MSKRTPSHISALLAMALALSACGSVDKPPIEATAAAAGSAGTIQTVTGGKVQGEVRSDVLSFKGIPFAGPPVGANRWRDPQPVVPWTGIKQATEFAKTCPQKSLFGIVGSEDCLYVNVWRPASASDKPLPVFAWIYGGGFTGGTANSEEMANLAKRDIIVVTMAYRIGMLGFLTHPELSSESGHGSGNYGLKDQIAALQWIQTNIANFGGDPKQVTIGGASAGAHSVSMLGASPAAKGLFHRAFSESGGSYSPIRSSRAEGFVWMGRLKNAEQEGVTALIALGSKNIAQARALDVDAVVKAKFEPWPVVDDYVIVGDQTTLYQQGAVTDTPIMVGSTSDEGAVFVPKYSDDTWNDVTKGLGAGRETLLKAYPHATEEERLAAMRNILRDSMFGWQTWTWARLQSKHGTQPAYAFYFDFADAPYFFNLKGPKHGADYQFFFGTQKTPNKTNSFLTNSMMSYLVNFIRTGNPNGTGLPDWPKFGESQQEMLHVTNKLSVIPVPNLDQLQALDAYYEWRRSQR